MTEQQQITRDVFAITSFGLTRRRIMMGLPASIALASPLMRRIAWAQEALASDQLVVHRAAPLVAEPPLASLIEPITPNDRFFILTIMADPLPDIAPAEWGLSVEGHVESPFSLDYEELTALPARTVTAVVECAGNSRNAASPPLPSSFLNNGYVGNARWRGVPLQLVLERARLRPEAHDVVLESADRGRPSFAPEEEAAFAKGIPIEKALHPDTLVVYEMNGVPLPREHGGPVRALVPGWYGTYQVKWLTRIEVLDRPFDGVFMTASWRVRHRDRGHVRQGMVDRVAVKSLIFTPEPATTLPVGTHTIRGAAWSGGKDIASVQVSTDGGATWQFARLLEAGHESPYAWRSWELAWEVREPGSYTLMARATDTSGAAQPFAYDLDNNGFMVNHVQPVPVQVG
jgi:DMSO/TMAO reductase YedYZ molybdopterin-dependent catalytic subunit